MKDNTNGDVGRATSIGLSEAVLILRGWVDDSALVRCELQFSTHAAGFLGRAVEASETRFRLMSDDTETELVLPIRAGFTFGYTDMRDGPPEDTAKYDGLMVVFLPYVDDPGDADRIVLCLKKE